VAADVIPKSRQGLSNRKRTGKRKEIQDARGMPRLWADGFSRPEGEAFVTVRCRGLSRPVDRATVALRVAAGDENRRPGLCARGAVDRQKKMVRDVADLYDLTDEGVSSLERMAAKVRRECALADRG